MQTASEDIQQVRSDICNMILLAFAIVAVPIVVASGVQGGDANRLPDLGLQIIIAVSFLTLFVFRKRVAFALRAAFAIFGLFYMAVSASMQFGILAEMSAVLLLVPVLALVFFGTTTGIFIGFALVILLSLAGVAALSGAGIPTLEIREHLAQPKSWVVSVISLAGALAILLASTIKVQNYLFNAVANTRQRQRDVIEKEHNLEAIVAERTRELGASQHQFSQLIANTGEGYWQIDPTGMTLAINDAMCRILGRGRSELLKLSARNLVDEENEKILLAQLEKRRKGIVEPYEVSFLRPDGTKVICVNHPTPIFDADGNLTSSIGLWTDITKIRTTQKLMEVAHAEAQAANAAKSAFLANLSHEIRTPMNGVLGMVEVLAHSELKPDQRRMVETIDGSAKALLNIIDDLLDLSEIETAKLNLEDSPVRLRDTVEDAIRGLRSKAFDKGVRLHFNFDPSLPQFIRTDSVRFGQIVTNLLSNAIKFSSRNGEKGNGRVEVRIDRVGEKKLAIKVIDNGIGLSHAAREKLFQAFAQADASTTRQYGGTGLGLVIVNTLVQLMGGTIDVDSEPGIGSIFSVTLPFVETDGKHDDPDISGVNIVALVDESSDPEGIKTFAERYGATVTFADDEDRLASLVSAARNGTIVLLSHPSVAENDRVRQRLAENSGRIQFLEISANPRTVGPLAPGHYCVQGNPLLPSEFLRGLSDLADPKRRDAERSNGFSDTAIPAAPGNESRKILLVEDNEVNREVISLQVHMLGYGVEVAENGAEGLEKWQSNSFDLILLDCHMPVMDGFQMTRHLRRKEQENGGDRTPIVAITANALKGEAEHCLSFGMDDYLAKPVELVNLKQTLEKWLNR